GGGRGAEGHLGVGGEDAGAEGVDTVEETVEVVGPVAGARPRVGGVVRLERVVREGRGLVRRVGGVRRGGRTGRGGRVRPAGGAGQGDRGDGARVRLRRVLGGEQRGVRRGGQVRRGAVTEGHGVADDRESAVAGRPPGHPDLLAVGEHTGHGGP